MLVGQRKVAKAEANPPGQPTLDPLDRAERRARVGALVVAVLEDQPSRGRTANMINGRVQRLEPGHSTSSTTSYTPETCSFSTKAESASTRWFSCASASA